MKIVPPANVASCYYCHENMDTRDYGIFQFVSGWVENRVRGGANAIAIPQRAHRFACSTCIDRLRKGIPTGQMRMWDE